MEFESVKLHKDIIAKLKELKHDGQTYSGFLRELLKKEEEDRLGKVRSKKQGSR